MSLNVTLFIGVVFFIAMSFPCDVPIGLLDATFIFSIVNFAVAWLFLFLFLISRIA